MNDKLLSQLATMKEQKIKPNFAELARKFDCDYRTVKKYYEGYEGKPKTRDKPSKLDQYGDLIESKLSIKGTSIRGVYEYMIDNDYEVGSYSNFSKYIKQKGLKPKEKSVGHPRFETLPGTQAQVDWKENIKLSSRSGEVFLFNVFNLELGYSRFNHLVYSKSKDQYEVFRSMISAFKRIGGIPQEIVFDNMRTAASISKNGRTVNPLMSRFARDCNFKVILCKPRHSYTKGKVEARNKIIDWIRVYDRDFENESHLIEIIEKINKKMNEYVCQATNQPPLLLLQKETEYLNPIPPKSVLDIYQAPYQAVVGKDALVYFKGNKYSVRPALIGQNVSYEALENKLYIYYNEKLETIHEIKPLGQKSISYQPEHYGELMTPHFKDIDELDDVIETNLKNFDKLLGD